jgi:hypothetical protein
MQAFSKEYFDNWLQKFFSFFVSVKMIIIVISFSLAAFFYGACKHLLISGRLTGDQFVQLMESDLKYLSVIICCLLGTRGAIQISEVLRKKTLKRVKEKAKEVDGD